MGKSFARADNQVISKNVKCAFDQVTNAIHAFKGECVLAKLSESPEVFEEADFMYSGMHTVLLSLMLIESYTKTELKPGECRCIFRLPVDSAWTTLPIALNDIQEVLLGPMSHMMARTEVIDHFLNYNITFFCCADDNTGKVYYYL